MVIDEHTEELLSIHEEEIRRLKEERKLKGPLLKSIKKYFDICQDQKELAAAAQDQSRLLGRGPRDPGRLLREEKMRKRVTKEKPKVSYDHCVCAGHDLKVVAARTRLASDDSAMGGRNWPTVPCPRRQYPAYSHDIPQYPTADRERKHQAKQVALWLRSSAINHPAESHPSLCSPEKSPRRLKPRQRGPCDKRWCHTCCSSGVKYVTVGSCQ